MKVFLIIENEMERGEMQIIEVIEQKPRESIKEDKHDLKDILACENDFLSLYNSSHSFCVSVDKGTTQSRNGHSFSSAMLAR